MKKLLLLSACLALYALPPAAAQTTSSSCFTTRLQSSSGATMRLGTGQTYMIAPGADRSKASVWLPLDKLRVCRGKGSASLITDLSREPPQTITAIRQ